MPSICTADPAKPYGFQYFNCLHGLGHGLTIRFDQDIFKALPFCTALGKLWEQQSCYGGVFMQNIIVDGTMHLSKDTKLDDPIYPCNAVPLEQKRPCYDIQTAEVLKFTKYDIGAAFKICDGVEADFVPVCYESMGRDISGMALLDPVKIVNNCGLGRPELQGFCFMAASKNAVFEDHNLVRANELCDLVGAAYREQCIYGRDLVAASF